MAPRKPVEPDSSGMAEMKETLKELTNEIKSLKESIEFQSNQFDEIMNKLKQHDETIKAQTKQITIQSDKIRVLEEEKKQLFNGYEELTREVNALNQYSRNKNIEIHGIEEKPEEHLPTIINDIAEQLRIPFKATDVESAHRIPSKRNKRKAIIVQFTRRDARNSWLKKRITGLTSKNIIENSDDEKIFINVNLSPKRKDLFWKARVAQKMLNFEICRIRDNGDIIMKKRKDDYKERPLIIRSESDLPLTG